MRQILPHFKFCFLSWKLEFKSSKEKKKFVKIPLKFNGKKITSNQRKKSSSVTELRRYHGDLYINFSSIPNFHFSWILWRWGCWFCQNVLGSDFVFGFYSSKLLGCKQKIIDLLPEIEVALNNIKEADNSVMQMQGKRQREIWHLLKIACVSSSWVISLHFFQCISQEVKGGNCHTMVVYFFFLQRSAVWDSKRRS